MLNILRLSKPIFFLFVAFVPVTGAQGQSFEERRDAFVENLSNYTNWFTPQRVSGFTIQAIEYDVDATGQLVHLTARFSFRPERDGKISPIPAHLQCGDARDARADTLATLMFDNSWRVYNQAGSTPIRTNDHLSLGGSTNTYSATFRPVAQAQVKPTGVLCFLDLPLRLEEMDGLETASAVFDPSRCKPKIGANSTHECEGIQNEPSGFWFRAIEVRKSKDFIWSSPDDDIHPINIECVNKQTCTYAFRNIGNVDLVMVRGRCLRGPGHDKVVYFKTENIGPHNLRFICE